MTTLYTGYNNTGLTSKLNKYETEVTNQMTDVNSASGDVSPQMMLAVQYNMGKYQTLLSIAASVNQQAKEAIDKVISKF